MDRKTETELRELTRIATRVMEEGRAPTEDERRRFRALRDHIDAQPADWKSRLALELDRFAAALEGMGI
jgi:hypothetical protein